MIPIKTDFLRYSRKSAFQGKSFRPINRETSRLRTGKSSTSNHGCLFSQPVLRQLGCGRGSTLGPGTLESSVSRHLSTVSVIVRARREPRCCPCSSTRLRRATHRRWRPRMSMMPRMNRSIWLPSREVQIRATQSPAGVLSARRRDLGPVTWVSCGKCRCSSAGRARHS